MNEVEDSTSAASSASQPSSLEQEYAQVNENFRRLSDIRFKLLAFVPALGGAAVYALATAGLSADSARQQANDADLWLVALIAAAGFCVTLGIILYDQRNSELYNALIHRAKHLESTFPLPRSPKTPKQGIEGGQFNERPGRNRRLFGLPPLEMGHDKALALIYGPVLGAWFFPFLLSGLSLARYSLRTSFQVACLVAVLAAFLFTWELWRQDRKDNLRWTRAGLVAKLIETLVSDVCACLPKDPPANEDDLNVKVGGILDRHRPKFEEKRPRVKFEQVRSAPDRPLEGRDLLIVSKRITGQTSLREAVAGIARNLEDELYPKRCHILLLAYDPGQALAEKEERKVGIELEGRCTMRIVRSEQQVQGHRERTVPSMQPGEQP